MTYRLIGLMVFAFFFLLSGWVFSEGAKTNRSGESVGFVGEEEVILTRVKEGRLMYPKSALRRKLEGEVIIEYNVGIDGTVSSAYIVEANPPGRFDSAALRYVNSFEYTPYRHNGAPTEIERIMVKIPFRVR